MKHGVYGIPGIYFGDIEQYPKIPQQLIFTPSSAYITDYTEKEIIVNVNTDISEWFVLQETGDFYKIDVINSTQFKIKIEKNLEQTFKPRVGIIGFYVGFNRYSYYQIKQNSKYYFKIDIPNPYNKDYLDEDIVSIIDTNVSAWDAKVIKGNEFCSIIDKTTNSITTHVSENKTDDYRISIVRFSAFADEEALQFIIGQEMAQGEKDFKIYAAIDAQAQTKEYIVRQIHSTQWYAEVSPYSTRTPILTASGNKLIMNFSAYSGANEAITIINVYPKIGEKPVELLFVTVGGTPPVPGKYFTVNPSGPFTAYAEATNIPIVISQQGYDGWTTRINSANRVCSISPVGGTAYNIVLGEYTQTIQTISTIDFLDSNGTVITSLVINNMPGSGDKHFNILTQDITINENAQTVVFQIEQIGYDGWTFNVINNLRPYTNKFVAVNTANIVFEEYDGEITTNVVIFKDAEGNNLGQRTITTQPGAKSFVVVEGDKTVNGDAQQIAYTIQQTGYNDWNVEIQSNKRVYTNLQKSINSLSIDLTEYTGEATDTIIIFKSNDIELVRRTIHTVIDKKFNIIEGDQEIDGKAKDIVFNIVQQGYDDNWTVEINSPKRSYGTAQQSNNLYKLPLNKYSGEDTDTVLTFKSEGIVLDTRTIHTTNSKLFEVDKDEIVEISDGIETVVYTVTQAGYDNQWNVIIESERYATKQINGNLVTINFNEYDGPSVYTTIKFMYGNVTLATRKIYTRATEKKFEISPSSVNPISGEAQSITFTITQVKYDGWDASISSSSRSATKSKQGNTLTVNFAEYYGSGTNTYIIFKDVSGREITRINVISRDSEKEFSVTPTGPIEVDHNSKTLYFTINHKGYNGWTAVVESSKRSCIGTKTSDTAYKLDIAQYEEYGDDTVSYVKFYSSDNILLQELRIDTKIKRKDFNVTNPISPITGEQQDVYLTVTQHGYDGWNVELESTRYCEKVVSGSNITLKFSDYYGSQTDTIIKFKYGTQTLAERVITTSERQKQFNVVPDKTTTPELLANGTTSYEFTITQDGYSQWYAEIDSSSTRKGSTTRSGNKLIVNLNSWADQYTKGSTFVNIYKESGASPIIEKLETAAADKDTVGVSFSTLYADGYSYAIIESGKTIKDEISIPIIVSFYQNGSTQEIRDSFTIPSNSSGIVKITNVDIHTRITEEARNIWFRPNGSSEREAATQIIIVNEREGNYFAIVDTNSSTNIGWNSVGKDAGLKQTVYSHYVTADGRDLSNNWYFTKTSGDEDLQGEQIVGTNQTVRWSNSRNLETTSRSASFKYTLENIIRETSLGQGGISLSINMEFSPSIDIVPSTGQSGTMSITSNVLTDAEIKEMFADGMLEIIQSPDEFINFNIYDYSYNIQENTNSAARTTDVILRMYFRQSHAGHKDMATVHCLQYGTPAPEEDTILIANDLSDYSSSFRVGLTDTEYIQPTEYVTITKGNSKKLKYDANKYVGFYLENSLTVNGKLKDRDANKDLSESAKIYGQNAWVYYKMSKMLEWSTKTSGVLANIGLTNQ